MLKLVVSDLHLGSGGIEGEFNPFEDFHYDDKFAELIEYYSSGPYQEEDVELILNGDILDLIKVDVRGVFPDRITEQIAVEKVAKALNGHPKFVEALRKFIAKKNKQITYIMGNHDLEIAFPAVQKLFRAAVGGISKQGKVNFVVYEPHVDLPGGVRICHGNQYEALNHVDLDTLFISKGYVEPILNLPWGSIFLLKVLLPAKARRPYINLVYPFSRYLSGALLMDTRFAVPLTLRAAYYFLKTRFVESRKRSASLTDTIKILLEEANPNRSLEEVAYRVLEENPHLTVVIMGHSHVAKVRRYKRGRLYINTGTWTKLINLELNDLGVHTRFTYAVVDYTNGHETPVVKLCRWFGSQPEWVELKY